MMRPAFVEVDVERTSGEGVESRRDQLAVEEPLEIRLVFGSIEQRQEQSLSITMRTPEHDAELAAGFLLSEGIVATPGDIEAIRQFEATNETGDAANIVPRRAEGGLDRRARPACAAFLHDVELRRVRQVVARGVAVRGHAEFTRQCLPARG